MENLAQALRLQRTAQIAIVGAGGKTAALFRLAGDLGPPALLAASAHLGAWQLGRAQAHFAIRSAAELEFLETDAPTGVVLLTGPLDVVKQRTRGLDAGSLDRLHALAARHAIPLLIEADGARQRALKVPAAHEPPIPPFVDTVLVVAGLSALGHPLDDESVYGADRFAALSGLRLGEAVTPEAVVRVLTHPDGGLKNIPAGARRIALLNQADTPGLRQTAEDTALRLLDAYDAVAITALERNPAAATVEPVLADIEAVYEPTAAIVLAAGGSQRMGTAKLLLPWRGEPVIRHTVRAALASGAAHSVPLHGVSLHGASPQGASPQVIVVTGANAQEIEAALEGLPVVLAHNASWEAGQSGSVRTGLQALAKNTGAALFLLGDQPQIPPALLQALIQRHARTHAPAIAPYASDRRGNPVLFDRTLFAELAALQGDAGGRQVLSQVRVERLDWPDETILLDLDTPQDYDRLRRS